MSITEVSDRQAYIAGLMSFADEQSVSTTPVRKKTQRVAPGRVDPVQMYRHAWLLAGAEPGAPVEAVIYTKDDDGDRFKADSETAQRTRNGKGIDWDSLKGPYIAGKRIWLDGKPDANTAWIQKKQDAGAGVFILVQENDGTGKQRKKADIRTVRAVWHEDDAKKSRPRDFPLPASFVVESSPGKFHSYWLLEDEMSLDAADGVNQHLVDNYLGDNSAKDCARVLRLAGTWNLKPGRAATPVRLIEDADGLIEHRAHELIQAFPPPVRETGTAKSTNAGTLPVDAATIRQALAFVRDRANGQYWDWLELGMALHHWSQGSVDGLAIWQEACEESGNPAECEVKWSTFDSSKDGGLTIGTVLRHAYDAGFTEAGDGTQSRDELFNETVEMLVETHVLTTERSGNGKPQIANIAHMNTENWIISEAVLKQKYRHIWIERPDEDGDMRKYSAVQAFFDTTQKFADYHTFRPDMASGYAVDRAGRGCINTFITPYHEDTNGNTQVFWDWLEGHIPDDNERNYFVDFLAKKLQQPAMRGPGIITVSKAGTQGTGRGTRERIISALFNNRNVENKGFKEFTGGGTAGEWNDWMTNTLIVTVNEAKDGDTGSKAKASFVYEALKDMVDPAASMKGIRKRGTTSFNAWVFYSTIIDTNHEDAVKLDPNDRRFYVLETDNRWNLMANGRERTDGDPAHPIHAWMANEANIGALWAELMADDVSHFNPTATPPMTAAKERMIEATRSPIERIASLFKQSCREHDVELVSTKMVSAWIDQSAAAIEDEIGYPLEQQEKMRNAAVAMIINKFVNMPRPKSVVGSGKDKERVRAVDAYAARRWSGDARLRTSEYRRGRDAILNGY